MTEKSNWQVQLRLASKVVGEIWDPEVALTEVKVQQGACSARGVSRWHKDVTRCIFAISHFADIFEFFSRVANCPDVLCQLWNYLSKRLGLLKLNWAGLGWRVFCSMPSLCWFMFKLMVKLIVRTVIILLITVKTIVFFLLILVPTIFWVFPRWFPWSNHTLILDGVMIKYGLNPRGFPLARLYILAFWRV